MKETNEKKVQKENKSGDLCIVQPEGKWCDSKVNNTSLLSDNSQSSRTITVLGKFTVIYILIAGK